MDQELDAWTCCSHASNGSCLPSMALVIQPLTTLIPGIPFFVPGGCVRAGVGAVVAAMGQLLINHRTGHRYMWGSAVALNVSPGEADVQEKIKKKITLTVRKAKKIFFCFSVRGPHFHFVLGKLCSWFWQWLIVSWLEMYFTFWIVLWDP